MGIAIQGLRNVFIFNVEFRAISLRLRYLDYILSWSELLSYIAFLFLVLILLRLTWRNLIRCGLIDELKVLPENRPLFRRAVLLPLMLILAPALLAFTALRLISAFSYAGPFDALMMFFGFIPPSSRIIYTYSFTVYHMFSIVLLAVILAMPTWREIAFPSIARNAMMLVIAACIPIIIFAFEQIHIIRPAMIQIIFTFILSMTVYFESRTHYEDIVPEENK